MAAAKDPAGDKKLLSLEQFTRSVVKKNKLPEAMIEAIKTLLFGIMQKNVATGAAWDKAWLEIKEFVIGKTETTKEGKKSKKPPSKSPVSPPPEAPTKVNT